MNGATKLKMQLAKQLINRQLECSSCQDAIAEQLGMSYHNLRKQFYKIEGITLGAYYNERRLEIAKELLQKSEFLIFQVADAVGFSTGSNFARWFKRNTGISPTNYQKKRR